MNFLEFESNLNQRTEVVFNRRSLFNP